MKRKKYYLLNQRLTHYVGFSHTHHTLRPPDSLVYPRLQQTHFGILDFPISQKNPTLNKIINRLTVSTHTTKEFPNPQSPIQVNNMPFDKKPHNDTLTNDYLDFLNNIIYIKQAILIISIITSKFNENNCSNIMTNLNIKFSKNVVH